MIGYPIYYQHCIPIGNGTSDNYYKTIDKIVCIYYQAGYWIKTVECYGEYKSLMDKVNDAMGIVMNYTNEQDHEPCAECNNHTIKESFGVALHCTGYTTIPCNMIEDLAKLSAEHLNIFPAKYRISSYYIPMSLGL